MTTPQHRIEIVWPDPSPEARAEAVALWLAEGALRAREIAEERAAELLAFARDPSGHIVGIATAFREQLPRFPKPFFIYRTFVAAAYRRTQVASALFYEAVPHLARRYASGTDQSAVGVYLNHDPVGPLSAPAAALFAEPVWDVAGLPMFYAGLDESGRASRILYFPGARLG
jgi:GNAT superfamily N-acetyltransferase